MKTFGFIIAFLFTTGCFAQQDSVLKNNADRLMKKTDYAGALIVYKQYISKAKKITDTYQLIEVYDSAYVAGLLSKNYPEAEKYLVAGFEYCRAQHLTGDTYDRLTKVVEYYTMAQLYNWALHPPATDRSPRSLIFPVTSVKYLTKDTSIITIRGGSVEGLHVGLDVQGLGTKQSFLTADRSTNVLGRGKITKVDGDVSTLLFVQSYTTDSSDNIYPKDVIYCEVNAPFKNGLGDYQFMADKDIAFLNNYREPPYTIRQIAMYDIPKQEQLLDSFFLNSVMEIAQMLRDDTVLASKYITKMPTGFFKDMTLTEAMLKTTIPHIRAFLKYVKQYPGKYYGQRFKFSEVYATWLINSSPLDDYGLLELLEEYRGTPFYDKCLAIYDSSITMGRQWLVWKDVFLDSLDNGKMETATWEVLQQTAGYYREPWMRAWTQLLAGRVAAYNKKGADASALINDAKKQFDSLKMTNEVLFAENTLVQVNNQRVARVALQTNHSLPFSVSFSTDGKYFATYGDDFSIKVWDAKLVRQIETIQAHVNTINQVTFSPNNRYFISASDDGFIRVWDTRSMHLYKEINTPYRVKYAGMNRVGDRIMAAGNDSSIHVYDFENGRELNRYVIHKARVNTADYNPDFQQYMYTGGSDSISYITNIETGKWLRWFRSGGRVSTVKASEDRLYFAALSDNSRINLWQQNGSFLGYFPTTKYKFTSSTIIPSFDINGKKKVMAFADDKGKLTLATLDSMRYYPYDLKFEGEILDIKIHPNGNSLLLTTTLGKLYFINITQFYLSHGSNIQSKMVGSNATLISAMSFSDDDNLLAYQSGSTYIMDLATGKNTSLGEEGYSQLKSNITFSNNDSALIYVPLDARCLQEKNFYTGDTLASMYPHPGGVYGEKDKDKPESGTLGIAFNAVSPDKKLSAIWFNKTSINIYDNASKKLLHKIVLDTNQTQLILALFLPGNKFVVCNDVNNSVSFYNLQGDVLKPFSRYTSGQGYEFGNGCYDPRHNRVLLPCQNNNVYIFDAGTGKPVDSLNFNFLDKEEGASIVRIHPDGHTIFIGLNYMMLIYDLDTRKVVYNFNMANSGSSAVQFSHDGNMLAVGNFRGGIDLYETRNYKKLLQVQTFSKNDPVWMTTDNFYIANRSSLQDLYFNYNHTLYPFDQFDINFNRPDTVLERLGKIDPSLLRAYKEAWVKRFRKSGIPAERLRPDFKVPEIQILNADQIPAFLTVRPYIPLQLLMKDDNARVTSYNIWVNGVPLYGKDGKKINAVKEVSLKDSVLVSGINNVIQVSCKNEFGVESLKEKFEVKNYTKDTARIKTYLFVVSVSAYRDKQYTLKYARKDGRDLVNAFKHEYGNDIIVDTLFDDKATLPNILAWRKKMENTTVKDRVIMYVSGHGLLDKNYDFYYATWDVNFKDPSAKGLAYEDLEKLLDRIPARRKLLLMDACHSGEVDKEAVAMKMSQTPAVMNNPKINVVYQSKGAGEDISNARLGLSNSFELMQDLFTNLNNGNGTAVISAAAGNSYAYESDVWNNGIFTYCILHGLKDKAADLDNDQRVSVSELQKFVSNEVQRLTQGAQKPTARQENLDNDWFIW